MAVGAAVSHTCEETNPMKPAHTPNPTVGKTTAEVASATGAESTPDAAH